MINLEDNRVQAVYQTGLLDTPAEGRFDRITRIARRLFRVSMSTIALLDNNRQWFKSSCGWTTEAGERKAAFCDYAIQSDNILVIPDTLADVRFRESPLVTSIPNIRFYAGRPLYFSGERVGTLCVMDHRPREWTAAEAQDLHDLACWVERELGQEILSHTQRELLEENKKLRELATVDSLTRAWNRSATDDLLARELSVAQRSQSPVGLVMCDVDHFKHVNDSYGHDIGDLVLREVADHIRMCIRPYDALGRYGGEEFLLILPKTDVTAAVLVAERVREGVQGAEIVTRQGQTVPVTMSFGVTVWDPKSELSATELYKQADQALYASKNSGRNRVTPFR